MAGNPGSGRGFDDRTFLDEFAVGQPDMSEIPDWVLTLPLFLIVVACA